MSALERDLKCVLANQRYVLDTQLFCLKVLHARKTSRDAGLAATLSARACPSELLGRVGAVVPALPRDLHDLSLAVDVDRQRKGIRVFQVSATER